MFSVELKKLIEASLVDGVLTETERAAIIKRAIIEGNDPAEVNILLDAELQQLRNKKQAAAPKVNKCPACGEILPPLTRICPTCGYTVSAPAATATYGLSTPQDLETLIGQLNRAVAQLKAGTGTEAQNLATIEELRRKAITLYGENQKVQMVIADIDKEVATYKKGALKRTLRKKSGCIIGIVIAIVVLIFGSILNSADEKKADEQYDKLVKKLETLKKEPITAKNVNQKIADLNDLIWVDSDSYIPQYERKKKEAFEKLVENYRDQLDAFQNEPIPVEEDYDEDDGSEEDEASDE